MRKEKDKDRAASLRRKKINEDREKELDEDTKDVLEELELDGEDGGLDLSLVRGA